MLGGNALMLRPGAYLYPPLLVAAERRYPGVVDHSGGIAGFVLGTAAFRVLIWKGAPTFAKSRAGRH